MRHLPRTPHAALLSLLTWLPLSAAPAAAQSISIRDFPKTFGSYAPGGDCARQPRVALSANGIRLETAAGTGFFPKPDVMLGYVGREDHSTTFFLQGPGEGLVMSVEGNKLWTTGGEHLGPVERAVHAVADANRPPLRRCGAQRAEPTPPPAPAAPKMRASAARNVDELMRRGYKEDPGFDDAYRRALGPLAREGWLIDLDGPGDTRVVSVAGARYLQVESCKEHDCGDNAMVVLYQPDTGALYGIVSLRRRKTTIGHPPPGLMPELARRWQTAWPNG